MFTRKGRQVCALPLQQLQVQTYNIIFYIPTREDNNEKISEKGCSDEKDECDCVRH